MKNTQLGYYLAGLIEGDGCILTPKNINDKSNPRIFITFHKNELPMFEYLMLIIGGRINYQYGNTYRYSIANRNTIIFVINLINGKFRTPKLFCLYKAIDILNLKYNLNLSKLALDSSNIDSNPWLAGFVDADGCFMISLSGKYAINSIQRKTRVRCHFSIKQRIIDKLSGESCKPFMTDIANFFEANINQNKNNSMVCMVQYTSKHHLVKGYFDKYPLMTSKYLNYLSYLEGLNYLGRPLNNEDISKIQYIKNSMNNNRKEFNWDHLKYFYT